jgi:3-hydroxyisobutyrate dehydrogenase-like beta-hydroxyacid dehydrogenase
LDLAQMVDVLNVSTGRSMASADKFPRSVVTRSYDFGFAGALMAKDVALYLEGAAETGAPHDVAAAVNRLWQEFDRANPGADFTRIHKYLEELADP